VIEKVTIEVPPASGVVVVDVGLRKIDGSGLDAVRLT
jgi:hypothetical protein